MRLKPDWWRRRPLKHTGCVPFLDGVIRSVAVLPTEGKILRAQSGSTSGENSSIAPACGTTAHGAGMDSRVLIYFAACRPIA